MARVRSSSYEVGDLGLGGALARCETETVLLLDCNKVARVRTNSANNRRSFSIDTKSRAMVKLVWRKLPGSRCCWVAGDGGENCVELKL